MSCQRGPCKAHKFSAQLRAQSPCLALRLAQAGRLGSGSSAPQCAAPHAASVQHGACMLSLPLAADLVSDPAAGRWEVRIGLPGGRHVYLGLYPTEPEAARVYDRALVLLSGPAAATNFPASNYSFEMSLYSRHASGASKAGAGAGRCEVGCRQYHWVLCCASPGQS